VDGGTDGNTARDAHIRDQAAEGASGDSRVVDVAIAEGTAPGCTIGTVSYAPNQPSPGNACQSCQPKVTPSAWTDAPDGTTCEAAGTCRAGACVTCSSPCTTDGDCQSRCPATDGGRVNCCETVTSTCFVTEGPLCPDQSPPPTCAGSCTAFPGSSNCQSLCPQAPAGTIMCCDSHTSSCAPFAQATCPGSLACPRTCLSSNECSSSCPAAPAGSSNCCYGQTAVCYVSPTPECPE
jgi:hypothetical protein